MTYPGGGTPSVGYDTPRLPSANWRKEVRIPSAGVRGCSVNQFMSSGVRNWDRGSRLEIQGRREDGFLGAWLDAKCLSVVENLCTVRFDVGGAQPQA